MIVSAMSRGGRANCQMCLYIMVNGGMPTGKVKWYDDERGYGFIQSDEGGPDVFVHQSEIQVESSFILDEGQSVEFEIKSSPKGPVAASVKPIDA